MRFLWRVGLIKVTRQVSKAEVGFGREFLQIVSPVVSLGSIYSPESPSVYNIKYSTFRNSFGCIIMHQNKIKSNDVSFSRHLTARDGKWRRV